ncbi:type II/IV secretion system protein [Moritella sp. 36]|uniref:GspE/PulE family protein n=1 Tax=Moritella sp. 36 TaxID=2746233 RepID=UPI001BAB6631|nr:GspE/PulE family protein [Moritella sp. 36]QUM89179.1 type II/IV secretion system protein [Moritella sp. 36]
MIRDNVLINAGIQTGMLDETEIAKYKLAARRERVDLLYLLSYKLRFPIADLYRAYAQTQGIRFLTNDEIRVDPQLLRKISPSIIERRLVIPLMPIDETALLLVDNPEDRAGLSQVQRLLPPDIEICMTDPNLLQQLVIRVTQATNDEEPPEFDPVISLDEMIREAYLYRTSDIHFEPAKETFHIRFRIDGCLQPYAQIFSAEQGAALMSRMKVLAGMDISEQRMPQDGGMAYELDNNIAFDIRAATVPVKFGERATLRLLGSDSEALSLKKIGFSERALARFSDVIKRPHGMILITGPTGSGKSTTLYSALQQIASNDINVLTVEDPIEYVMEGISQVQVSSKVSFSSALRSFLRHDPDVIMVGEIRDGETAGIAMKAALTGHMVFSTLHTNSAVSTVSRLVDIGAEPFLIGSTLVSIIAQRLVRRLCAFCKVSVELSDDDRKLLRLTYEQNGYVNENKMDETKADDVNFAEGTVYQAKGCSNCHDSGYKGRIALFETLWVDDHLAQVIGNGATEKEILDNATDFVSLADDCREKIRAGHTSIAEFERLSLGREEAIN